MKRKKSKTKKPVKRLSVEEAEEQIVDLEAELIAVRQQIKSLVDDVDKKRQRWIAETMQESGRFFQAMQNAMLRDLFDFLKSAPIWEVMAVEDLGVTGTSNPKVLKQYYDRGWRMLGFCYDPTTANRVGITLHRPKIPESLEEFTKLYQDFLMGKAPPQKPTKRVSAKKAVKRATRKTK